MTGLDWRWIKKISGYMPTTIQEGFAGDDPDLYLALSIIAMHRAGKIRTTEALLVAEALADAPWDGKSITIDFSDEEAAAAAEKAQLSEVERADVGEG
jgi:hypothetical protein